MVTFRTFTSLTPKQILKAGLIFSFLSAALLVANAKYPQAYFASPVNILRLIVTLILTLIARTLVPYFVGYFGEPFVLVYELLTKKIPLAWPIFRPLTPLDIIFLPMPAIGVFFALSLKNYLGRERRTLIWWLAAWMTISFFLFPFHSLLQSSEPETPAGPRDEVSQNQGQTFDGHYAGLNDSYLDVKTNAEGVVTISGQAFWYSDKTANTGEISGPITITNGQALYNDRLCQIDLEFTNAAIVAKERVYGTCGGLNVSFDGKYTKEDLAIKLLSTAIPAGGYEFVEGREADCQPEFFDPKITKFHKIKREAGTPSIMYYLDEDKYTHFMINGWRNEGEEKIILLPPYDLSFYQFGCASSSSYVLELSKNNQREALYTHAVNFNISPDKKYLYLANNIKTADGKWEKLRRIINIENKQTIKLPNMDCVSDLGFWDGETLITYSNKQEFTPYATKTKVCFWDTAGNLRSQLEAPLDWFAGAGYYLDSPMGLLPKDNDIFYAFIPVLKDHKCHLILQDLGDARRYKEIEIIENDVHCPRVDFDLNNLSFESKAVRFRLLDCSYDYDSPGDVEKCDWQEWQEAEVSFQSWQNFKDQEYHFSFKYPSNWLIKKHDEKTTVSVSNYPAGCAGCSGTEKQNYYEFYIQDKGLLTGEKRTNDASEYLLKERLELEKLARECQSNSTQPCLPRTPGPQQYVGEPKDLFGHLPASVAEVSPYHFAPDYGENFHLVQNEYVLIDNRYRLYTINLVSPGYPNTENKPNIKDHHPLVEIIKSFKLI